ncbi:MAG: KEOPS complex kinase/ATPase Bud32 [Candidatus Woesearchaeota archaeon]
MKEIVRGAEAVIYLKDNTIIKKRVQKSYRIKEIDMRLRKQRTKREAKILSSVKIPAPKLIKAKNYTLVMEKISGEKLRDVLEKIDYLRVSRQVGKAIRELHDQHIIHGDLTTSNMILKNGKVFFIDFGLSYVSSRIEDKAVDLHLLRQALESKHHTIWEKSFKEVCYGYGDKDVLARLEIVESRGRNKQKG